MQKFYKTAEVIKDKFLFISYSHDDQQAVEAWAEYLFDQGVRIWWDKAFKGGDDWETDTTDLLSHENCSGILFFASKSAIKSLNVAKEWRTAAKTKESRGDDSFYPQIIMAKDGENLDYHYLKSFVKKNDDLFSDDDYDDFRNLFGKKDPLFYSAGKESDMQKLLDTIKERVPNAVDEHAIVRDKLANLSHLDKEIILKLGNYNGKPITWHKIFDEGTESTLLCQDVLDDINGGQALSDWLKNFVNSAFAESDREAIRENIRLLTSNEAEKLPEEELASGRIWWLAESSGHLQAVVREDGTIYKNGYNNKIYTKGIRPVITMDSVALFGILNK